MVKVKEDLTGRTFGRLTVIKQVEDYISPSGYKQAQWLCECSCSAHNKIVVIGNSLKTGNTESCGCLKIENTIKRNYNGNDYILSEECGILWASNTNEEIYFDLEDADEILRHTWRVGSHGYPTTTINNEIIFMHTFLGYYYPDHHDRNKLNNRKKNLVSCTVQNNNQNRTIGKNNTSGIIGVCWHKKRQRWESYIKVNKKTKHLGMFNNKQDAIIARLQAEAKYFKDFAPQRHLFEEYNINLVGDCVAV